LEPQILREVIWNIKLYKTQKKGLEPLLLLTGEALSQGATTFRSSEEFENHQLDFLSLQLQELIRQEKTG
jgi:hypothetical protein